MVELARFKALPAAKLFLLYLHSVDIQARLDADGDDAVLLVGEQQVEEASRLLDEFMKNPGAEKFQRAAWASSEFLDIKADHPPLFSGQWFASMGPVTKGFFMVCVAVFASAFFTPVLYEGFLFVDDISALPSQPWRLLTPMLLHLSFLHILFNMLWWVELGGIVERFQSSFQLLWITLVTSAVSNLAQFYDTGPNFGGMSGVVYGLLGYLWLYGKTNPGAGYALRKEIVIFMLAWLVICWVGFADVVANSAHLGGLLAGCVLGVVTGLWRRMRYYQ